MKRYILLCASACLWFTAATAEMYRWVDEQGQTHFSQVPPPSGGATRLAQPAADPVGNSDTVQQMNQQWQQLQDRRDERREQEQEQQEDQQVQARRQDNCRAARNNLDVLQGPSNRLIKAPGEDYRRLTEEERQERIRQAEQIIERDCQ